MPQLQIRETQWANELSCTLIRREVLDQAHLEWLQSGSCEIFIPPTVSDSHPGVTLTYSLIGLVSLRQVLSHEQLQLEEWLTLLYAMATQLRQLPFHKGLLMDEDFIFLYGKPGVYLDFQHPRLICLPLVQSSADHSADNSTAGLLADLAETCIRLAVADRRLSHAQSDHLLLTAYETPAVFAGALQDCLHVLQTDRTAPRSAPALANAASVPLAEADNRPLPGAQADCGEAASGGPSGSATEPEKKHSIPFFLTLQILFLIAVGAARHLGMLNQPVQRLTALIMIGVFLLLDIALLISGSSPLKQHKTHRQRSAELRHREEKEAGAALRRAARMRWFNKVIDPQRTAAPPLQPAATLEPLELAYLDHHEQAPEKPQGFRPAHILRPVFQIGSDPVRCDLCLNSPEIRPLHARIEYFESGYRIRETADSPHELLNENEPNPGGIWLDGIKLEVGSDAPLKSGMNLRIGRFIYEFSVSGGARSDGSDYFVPNRRSPASPKPGMM